MKLNSIQVKIISLIIFVLFIIITVVVYISTSNQKNDLLDANKNSLSLATDILNSTIRNLMLSGEAPIAVRTISGIKSIMDFKDVELYRTDGSIAFEDFKTLEFVNKHQDIMFFEKTDRVEHRMIENESFNEVLENNLPLINEIKETKEMEYFFPIRNERECWTCHGEPEISGPIRGVAHFKISTSGIYKRINRARLMLILIFGIAGVILAFLIIVFIERIIIGPLFKIGSTVKKFGEGNFDLKVDLKQKDELGNLAGQINEMFKSTKERINLSKYVSRSTNEMIKKGIEGDRVGVKKEIVVLFSDIRGFTNYSSKSDPSVVIENLNRVLQIQANIVEHYGGDIDKFVGDELMAIFTDEYQAIKCAFEMIISINKSSKNLNIPLFVGVGINSGEVVAGNIGSQNRLEYAVIGDTVNLASRLCNIAKANTVIISEKTNKKLSGKIRSTRISEQKIKGISGYISYYSVQTIIKE